MHSWDNKSFGEAQTYLETIFTGLRKYILTCTMVAHAECMIDLGGVLRSPGARFQSVYVVSTMDVNQ